jgi:hypothetical protein
MSAIQIGDHVIVALRGHRVGRLGTVTAKAVEDAEWNPLVPKGHGYPHGEMGRRIYVRWDLTVGPDSRDLVVQLPQGARFTSGELRPTVARVQSLSLTDLVVHMNDASNWVGLLTHFDYERALSGYIAAYPHRLEDGLLPHPNDKIRERVFDDRSRLDVLLEDRNGVPVIVECKQAAPSLADIKQLRHYMHKLEREIRGRCRGILVHGGSKKLAPEVAEETSRAPIVEVVQYSLNVDFSSCS